MNASRIIISLVKRSFGVQRRWKKHSNPGIQKRLNDLEDESENNSELVENLDIDDPEPDFLQVHKSYSEHEKEVQKNKELLKLRIVGRKYFKEEQPSLLTYVEKEQIRFLHENDPVEYTPENLSESFPALPHTIKKILKVRWTPRSADRVIKHDQQVIENWKKFKRGQLPLEPRLREHLQKFKGRIISLPDKKEIEEKLLPPKISFEKPKSQLYSGIIQKYLDRKKDDEEAIVSGNNTNHTDLEERIGHERFDHNDLMDQRQHNSKNEERVLDPRYGGQIAILGNGKSPKIIESENPKLKEKDFFTLDKFFEDRVRNIDKKSSSIEDKVLLDTYKRKMESDIVREWRNIDSDNQKNLTNHGISNSVASLNEKDLQTGIEEKYLNPESVKAIDVSKEMGLETYVKVWVKKAHEDEDYPETIEIPKAKYKKGKLYKLRDCYYDDDGEFLYRVPGFKE